MKKCGGHTKLGFTIIEVSLVLGIAGLIFLAVFLALPSIQRSARDSRREEDMATFLRAVKDYQTANRGALPSNESGVVDWSNNSFSASDWKTFYDKYLGDDFTDPDGGKYNLEIKSCKSTATLNTKCAGIGGDPVRPTIKVVRQATCDVVNDVNTAVKSSNPRKIAILYTLELDQVYCASS